MCFSSAAPYQASPWSPGQVRLSRASVPEYRGTQRGEAITCRDRKSRQERRRPRECGATELHIREVSHSRALSDRAAPPKSGHRFSDKALQKQDDKATAGHRAGTRTAGGRVGDLLPHDQEIAGIEAQRHHLAFARHHRIRRVEHVEGDLVAADIHLGADD